jgi:hypothetical protein
MNADKNKAEQQFLMPGRFFIGVYRRPSAAENRF